MLEEVLWWFVLYAFFGWCVEVVYATVTRGIFINRGFLSGPYCPIYGFGALLVLWVTRPFAGNLLALFIVAMALTSILELLAGWLMKIIFNQRWWDYRDRPFNIGGYICLEFSIIWGLACVFVVMIIQPLIVEIMPKLLTQLGLALLLVFLIGMAADLIATITQMLKLKRQLLLVDEIDQRMRQISDGLGEKLSGVSKTALKELNELKQRHDETLIYLNQRYRRLIKAFPTSGLKDFLAQQVEIKLPKISKRRPKK